MMKIFCSLLCLLIVTVVGQEQECVVALKLQDDLSAIRVEGKLSAPIQASLFQDTPPIILQGSIPISLEGVECPNDLGEIGSSMEAAKSISFPKNILPPLSTMPKNISGDVLGLAELILQGLQVQWSNEMVDYDSEEGIISAPETVFNITQGEVEIISPLVEVGAQSLVGLVANSTLTALVTQSTVLFKDVNILVPVETYQQGITIVADMVLSGQIGGEIVSLEDIEVVPQGE